MTQDEIIDMARQALKQEPREDWNSTAWVFADETLEAFAKLVAEKAIKEALAQPEQIPPSADSNTHQPERYELQAKGEHPAPCARHCEANAFKIVIKNLKAQLAQPEQEPVAWISTSPARMIHWTSDKPAYGDDWIPLYTKEQL